MLSLIQYRPRENTTHYAYYNPRLFKQTFAYLNAVCSISIMENENEQIHYGHNLLPFYEIDRLNKQKQTFP